MEKISYKLDVFEGPLDLLLHLIEKNKLNIYDIRISELLRQYMEHIGLMQEQNLEIAGDFLTMASHLVQIKSAMLLPKYEEAEEMRKELSEGIKNILGIRAKVSLVAPKSIQRSEGKAVRVIDKRKI